MSIFLTLAAIYLVGTVVIGYPLAKFTLHVWKHHDKYGSAVAELFPLNLFSMTSCANEWASINLLLRSNPEHGRMRIASFILTTMVAWPLNVFIILIMWVAAAVSKVFGGLYYRGMRTLSNCDRCMNID